MEMSYTTIRLERDGGPVAEVVLNNPDKLNAMSPEFFEEIHRAFLAIEEDRTIRAAVVWAEGRLFTAGLDLKSAAESLLTGKGNGSSKARSNLQLLDHIKKLQACFSAIESCPKPVIAAVHGHCIGGGVDLSCACDIRLCTSDAAFSIHETKIAIVADLGTLQRISRIVGRGVAREMAFTGKRIGAYRALRCGFVNEVYPDKESLLAGARELAKEIAVNSPLAVQGAKIVLNYSDQHTIEEGLDFVAQWNASFLHSHDLTEAVAAFLQKRAPVFKGE
ncbi:crotonase/enoyl-CoA hydratase family protein [Candidatus Sumerlaeota bacterium]|nr:crotonase/enoyl-CoA hydratase family protein [Candidatus Sumerlaeota bacterium]